MEGQGSSYKFAVVQFDNLDCSVVPIIWLEEPNYCYWPTSLKNIRTAIIREMPVKDSKLSFTKYKCNIFSKHHTYETALEAEKQIVATSESENELRIGKRKVKSNKYEDYVTFSGPPRLITSSKESNELNIAVSTQKDNKGTELDNLLHNNENYVLTGDNFDNIPVVIPHENTVDLISFTSDLKKIITNIETEIKSIKETQEKSFLLIQETANLILAKINSAQCYKEDNVTQDHKIRQHLPLTSIQNLLDFENMLKDDQEAFMQVVNKVLLIGGKNEKDLIKRALSTMFADNLACICSWTGQKNNFKIGDTNIMLAITKAFKATFSRSTEKDFEHCVMEWFRFANVRRQKKELSNKD